MKVEGDGARRDVNPNTTFNSGDFFQVGITPNQSGYVYLVAQTEGRNGDVRIPPTVIFPNTRLGDGGNVVEKDKEFVFPRGGPARFDAPGGRTIVWVVFSKTAITDIPTRLVAGGPQKIDLNTANGPDGVPDQKLVRRSHPDEKNGKPYVIWVQNVGSSNPGTLVETIVLRQEDRAGI